MSSSYLRYSTAKPPSSLSAGGLSYVRYPTVAPAGFNPNDISNLTLWMDGSDVSKLLLNGSNEILSWLDKSASARNFVGISGSTLTYEASSKTAFRPGAGATTYTIVDSGGALISKTNPFTMALRVRFDMTGVHNSRFFSFHDGTNCFPVAADFYAGLPQYSGFVLGNATWSGSATNTNVNSDVYRTLVLTYNGNGYATLANFSAYVDGTTITLVASTLSGYDTIVENRIGGNGDAGSRTKAILLYGKVLSLTEIASVNTYLAGL